MLREIFPSGTLETMTSNTARRTLNAAVLIAFAVYFAFVCVDLSAHRMMWADELNAWNLLADPSWRHAFQSLNRGADSGTPVFYAIGRCLLAVAGLHPVVMRLYSAACFYFAAVIWAQILRRRFGDFIGVAAVFVAFLCNSEVLNQIAQVRFYGELMLAAAVAVRIALWLQESERSTAAWFFLSALGGLALVSAHPLGMVYSAGIVVAQLCTKSPVRKRAAMLIGTVLSWGYLLVFLAPVRHAADQGSWLEKPNAMDLLHFYDNHPLLFVRYRYASVLLNLILLSLAVYAIVWFIRSRKWKSVESNSFVLLFYIAVILLLQPIGFAILSNLYKPVFLGRYLLPYSLGLITLAAAGTWLLSQRINPRYLRIYAAVLVLPLIAIAYLSFAEQYRNPVSNLDPVLQAAQSMPTVIADDEVVRQAHLYTPQKAKNIFFVMLAPKPGEHTILEIIAEQGYSPAFVFDQPFLSDHRQFLYIEETWRPPFFIQDLQGNPLWRETQVGSVSLHGRTVPVLQFTRVDATDNLSRQEGPKHLASAP
jgi:hypothetical protein